MRDKESIVFRIFKLTDITIHLRFAFICMKNGFIQIYSNLFTDHESLFLMKQRLVFFIQFYFHCTLQTKFHILSSILVTRKIL